MADRTKIRLIECIAKCCCLKKLTCKGTLQQVFYLSAPSPPMHTVLSHTVYLFTQGRGEGRGESKPVRRLEGQWFTKPVEKNTNMTDCISNL